MRRSLQIAPLALSLLSGAPCVAAPAQEIRPGTPDEIERSIPRAGLTVLTDASYRKLREMRDDERRRHPGSDRLFTFLLTDARAPSSAGVANREERSDRPRDLVLGSYATGQIPDVHVRTIRGLKLFIVYNAETWRATRRQTIDYQDGRFVLATEQR